jgi:hypothetical protein
MSYSYIKSVFPNFENNKVYDESLYSNLQTPLAPQQQPQPQQQQPQELPLKKIEGHQESQPSYTFTDAVDRRQGSGSGDFASSTFEKSPIQNNLRFYNTPVSESIKDIEYKNINLYGAYNDKSEEYGASLIPEIKEIVPLQNKKLEKFEQDDCDVYIKHIVDCRRCRDMISRQFNIYDNEEMMEIVSYLIFGLFILLVINSLKNK